MAFYDNLKLEKGMYNSGNKSFTQVLEELNFSKPVTALPCFPNM